MPGPLILIPVAVIAALKAYVIAHGAHIAARAAAAAAREYVSSRDADLAAEAALQAGAAAATGDLVRDFFAFSF
ncbi:MAG: hypothetical protein AAFR64_13505 [Pseudomonadota bacterium]